MNPTYKKKLVSLAAAAAFVQVLPAHELSDGETSPYGALSAFALDPIYMIMLIKILGRDYVVWDKAASIDFVRPGVGTVTATFALTPEQVAEVRAATADGSKFEPVYPVEIRNAEGKLVARVNKTLWIRRRDAERKRR